MKKEKLKQLFIPVGLLIMTLSGFALRYGYIGADSRDFAMGLGATLFLAALVIKDFRPAYWKR